MECNLYVRQCTLVNIYHRILLGIEEKYDVYCVSALSAGVYTTTLLVMVDRVKWGGRAAPSLTWLGLFYHHDGTYARKWPLPICVYSVILPDLSALYPISIPIYWVTGCMAYKCFLIFPSV